MRLDKYLADLGIGTRSQVKEYLKKFMVTVNGEKEKSPARKILPEDVVCFQGKPVTYTKFEYYMFHKPAGCVTATKDNMHSTVLEYLKDVKRKDLFPVGRLDLDTEGFLLITNDGPLCHNLLSPKKHVPKMYYAKVVGEITKEVIEVFSKGIGIGDEKMTAPSILEIRSYDETLKISEIYLTITEGRFHQVKRMFHVVGSEVLYLKRISMGGITLDENLKSGEYRPLTQEEIKTLKRICRFCIRID